MKIAMINCLKANEVCAAASCLKAFNQRKAHFEEYAGQDVELIAVARCNGCDAGIDKGFQEKLDRLLSEGVDVCHFGVCTVKNDTKEECPVITKAGEYLEEHGVRLVRGTH